ncbi:hypothetical protein [Kutzneria sp. CA-103260]|uniref:hypothetical protein n=1 Tax=Kutzneria sp. CA-103260 TaxID=2802641 RepID=UPI001BA68D4A|nr:hypothetical protein [Kutzneria sp. CA-103260]
MTVPADPEPSALARWWWRTPVWSRLLASLGGGFTALLILTGVFGPTVPAQQPGAQPVVATLSTTTTATSTTTTTPSSTTPTTTTETTTTTTTTELPTTTTEAPAPPPATHQAPPATHQPAPPPTENPAPPPSDGGTVKAGEFCSTAGALAHTSKGTLMVCKRTATDSRLRWRAA